jgi:hypothetical protein
LGSLTQCIYLVTIGIVINGTLSLLIFTCIISRD